ncbi:hypothetical protein GOARA_091_00290 [Gordonia araii NBRC 100433]|uniref:Uncharacterized protein n=1 Tax=Gordonia araii NBRC 100433 TaxID=1073574 RepID=G7H7T6_9ACTN|nr:hypothetical protein [Gordonia araii]NNG95648.1 hypothetical protein [Gordonia araii NBRC 100433]GAB11911.1 hypothetical protein GOARA_091_00290 [Gordonia araii NBRC 100433]
MSGGTPAVAGPFPIADGLIPAPIDLTPLQAAEKAGLTAILNTPASEFLAKSGFPPLPEVPPLPPLPGLPPLPAINLEQLFKPLTDLAASFGSGNLGAEGFDPTTLFTTLSEVLKSGVGMSTSALKSLDSVWQGAAGAASAAKSTTAAAEGTAVATKAANIVTNTQGGAVTVGTGNASMQAVISKFIATANVALGMIWTPVGQTLLLTAAALALSEGMAVVTGTKATLTPQTAAQQANAAQMAITNAPKSVSPFSVASSVLEGVTSPISTLASTGSSMLGSLTKQNANANKTLAKNTGKSDKSKADAKKAAAAAAAAAAKKGGGGKGGGGGGKGGGGGVPATPLQPRPGVASVTPSGEAAHANTTTARSTTTAAMGGPGMMPMGMGGAGAAAAAGRAGAGDDGYGSPDFLVTSDHGSAVVGDMPNVTPAVIGGEHDQNEPGDESPDVELRL